MTAMPSRAAPPGQVENFAVRAKGAHAMTFSWDPPIDSTTGEVSYTLSCVPQPEGFPHSFSDSPRRVTLQGFQPECEYGCSVAAISNGLTGPTVSKFATTPRKCVHILLPCITTPHRNNAHHFSFPGTAVRQ